MAFDPTKIRLWKINSSFKSMIVVAAHCNLGRFALSICFWHLGNVVLLWLSFVCGQNRVVSTTACKEVCKFVQAHCNDHTSAGKRCCRGCFVSFNCNVMCFFYYIQCEIVMLFVICMTSSGRTVVADAAVMVSCRYGNTLHCPC